MFLPSPNATSEVRETLLARYAKYESLSALAEEYKIGYPRALEWATQAGFDVKKQAKLISSRTRAKNQKGLPNKPSLTDWAYIAGIYDGEGTLLMKVKAASRSFGVSIPQNGWVLQKWFKRVLGTGSIYNTVPGPNKVKTWTLYRARPVFEFLVNVYPYIIVKKVRTARALVYLADTYGWEDEIDDVYRDVDEFLSQGS